MAQMTNVTPSHGQIDDDLDYLVAAWDDLPALAAEWHEWDEASRFHFAVDWPIVEDRLLQLERRAAQTPLSPAQQARYEELHALVARYRPTLQRLLDDGWAGSGTT